MGVFSGCWRQRLSTGFANSEGGTRGGTPTRLASLGTLPRKREREEDYVDAVVTPPSTTMVWPVMKVEASEPR